jgi:glycosyltransferase involved in cell wall biosynthesis
MSSSPPREIVFFKAGGFSHVNENVAKILRNEFPGHALKIVDVMEEILKRRPISALRALADVLTIYPRQVFRHRRKPTDFLLRTPAAFRMIKQAAAAFVDPARTEFTLQTQSLFDAAQPGVPHFVYTDQACLANRRYPLPVDPELLNPRWLAVEKTVYESARLTFTTSTFAGRSLVEDYGLAAERTACVLSGTNVHLAPERAPRPFRGVVLFVGVDWKRKGGPDLVAAFLQIAEKHPEARLRIVGCTPPLSHPRIETLGRLSLEATAAQFQAANIFCLPSYHEPSAVALVEAQLSGLPVVTTNVGGSPDRLIDGQTGHLVPAGDAAALAAALSGLLGDPARCRAMGEAGRSFARERFAWEAVGRRLATRIRTELSCR